MSTQEEIRNGTVFERLARAMKEIEEARKGQDRILKISDIWKNATSAQRAGRIAEEYHAATFNMHAASKWYAGRASTGASNGAATAASDVAVRKAKQLIDDIQVKYYKTPVETTFNVAHSKYDGMQRVVPSDQLNAIKRIAKERGTDKLGIRNYEAVAHNVSDKIKVDSIQSTPISRTDAMKMATQPSTANSLVTKRVLSSIKNSAVTGGTVSGVVSAISNLTAYHKNNKSGKEAFVDTLKDTAGGAVSSGVVGGLAVTAEATLLRAGFRSAARSAAPVAIGLTLFDIGKDVVKACDGKLTGSELAKNAVSNIGKGATTWAGMEGGAIVGTALFPGVGTVVGGIFGGIAGCLFGGKLFS